ncbi:hypothetical protein [Paenibacillus aceris]|uniref:Uncharacterized sporulation protein YeaH/YhbH (DUF444 family) n=1 Tax=Paenibacillus aceris TaxID=869555 RepID=A0ABS4HRS8_9BACL|nr:hypothetical protein [Paenibacillus aceris]MBP1961324.1 uncharacterized sporulation protein YeaH/YhbH (DUF444 family) [Paenibacillus aceris]NHW37891.1 hypothetical protein [Paenibacillus aceris]
MIKTQDLKLQMDELTKQNDLVLIELEQVKKMLLGGSQGSQGSQGGQYQQQQASDSGQQQAQGQDQDQSQAQGQGQGQDLGQGQNQGQNQGQQAGQNGGNGQQVSDLANELLKIKDLVEKLEQKTSQYVSSQTNNGTLTEKDAVNLILTLMNGMVDWASEFVSSKASSNGQLQ